MDLNTTENKTIVDEKKELYNGIASILKSILQDISPIKCHDVDYDSYLKQEVYTHLQDTIDYEVFEEYYENNIENIYKDSKLIKRSYRYIQDSFDDEMTDLSEHIDYLKSIPQAEQRTQEWFDFRKKHITGSNVWKVFHTESSRNQLIYEKLQPNGSQSVKSSLHDTPLNWGHKYEPLTNMFYEYYNDVVVEEFGCIPHSSIPFLAASPDGIVTSKKNNGRMVEIKNVVSRVINQIPKMEYYIQMQLQMEVCNLNECDFVETKFIEYENEQAFFKDKYTIEKGMIIVLVKDNQSLLYEYSDLFQNKRQQLDNFSDRVYKKYNLDSITLENNGIRWFRNVYWKLDKYSCVLVPRNKPWFEEALPKIQELWNTIEKELPIEDSHLKYKGKTNKPKEKKANPVLFTNIQNPCLNLND